MYSLKFIRENLELVKKSIQAKNVEFDIDAFLILDDKRRSLIQVVEEMKAERNKVNKEISQKNDVEKNIESMRSLSTKIKGHDKELSDLLNDINDKLLYIPNVINDSVPIGDDENSNKIIREWGEKPVFQFKPKGHLELCESLGLIDFKRAVKMSGSGFPLYTNLGAKLERSLIGFMLDMHMSNGYKELLPPFLVTSNSPTTTGNLPKFKEDMYHIENDDLYCIPTAEVPVTNIFADEVLDEKKFPYKYCAYSACFRREAGSYGKDTRGLLRLHQFNKVELVKFVKPEDSYDQLESLLKDAEKILQSLNLHYRVVELCSGDLSFSAAKCYDIEVWSPYEKKYLEVSSCSNFLSFQSRRGNIKYRRSLDNKLDFVHTLNGSGLATPRLMVALLECYQLDNGQIEVPEVLIDYLKYSKISNND